MVRDSFVEYDQCQPSKDRSARGRFRFPHMARKTASAHPPGIHIRPSSRPEGAVASNKLSKQRSPASIIAAVTSISVSGAPADSTAADSTGSLCALAFVFVKCIVADGAHRRR